ncbi:MAG TPA: GntR family transcriptional regulator [Pseudolabrys sp.]|nr:GntR family transcriptional regulator [Pseudolabrys sp.]
MPAGDARRSESAVTAIVARLEEDIVLGRLHPRERLIEDALIARFAAKRHAVREALSRLERMGLVERQPNRGAAVRALTPREVEEIYAVREILEGAAAQLIAARATPALIDEFASAQRAHDAAAAAKDTDTAFRANIAFHRAFFAACGNAELAQAIDHFAQKAHGVRSFGLSLPGYLEQARDEHRAMIEALRARDGENLASLCREHIRTAKLAYIEAYQRRFRDDASSPRD